MVMPTLVLLRQDWLTWFGSHAGVSLSTMAQVEPGARLNLFAVIPQSFNYQCTVLVFLGIGSILTLFSDSHPQRDRFPLPRLDSAVESLHSPRRGHGPSSYKVFSDFRTGWAMSSIDRIVRVWRGQEGRQIQLWSPWAQWMIQFESALVYFAGIINLLTDRTIWIRPGSNKLVEEFL
jgi:hypothetical protein